MNLISNENNVDIIVCLFCCESQIILKFDSNPNDGYLIHPLIVMISWLSYLQMKHITNRQKMIAMQSNEEVSAPRSPPRPVRPRPPSLHQQSSMVPTYLGTTRSLLFYYRLSSSSITLSSSLANHCRQWCVVLRP